MVKSGERVSESGSKSSLTPFVKKCYDMVDDESTDDIISWKNTNDSFVIWDKNQFCVQLLPIYFKHQNFSSFLRQLNIYGFKKIDKDRWIFANDAFIRGKKHLLKTIPRKTASQTLPEEDVIFELREEIEKLKMENANFEMNEENNLKELETLRQRNEVLEKMAFDVTKRIEAAETRHQQVVSFLGTIFQYCPQEENNNICVEGEDNYQNMDYQLQPNPANENPIESNTNTVDMEKDEEEKDEDILLESSFLEFLEDDNIFQSSSKSLSPFAVPDCTDDGHGSWDQPLYSPFRRTDMDVENFETLNSSYEANYGEALE